VGVPASEVESSILQFTLESFQGVCQEKNNVRLKNYLEAVENPPAAIVLGRVPGVFGRLLEFGNALPNRTAPSSFPY